MNDPRRAWKSKIPASVLVGDADGFKIPPDHLGRLVMERQDGLTGRLANEPAAEVVPQGGRAGLLDPASGLLVGRSQDDPRIGGIEPEALGRQGTDLLGSEPGRQCEPIGQALSGPPIP